MEKIIYIFVFFFLLSDCFALENKTWNETDIINAINSEMPQKKSFLYDPYSYTAGLRDRIVNEYIPLVTEEGKRNFYFIIVNNIKDNLNGDSIRKAYNYSSESEMENSIFVIYGRLYSTWVFCKGSNLNISNVYMEDLRYRVRTISLKSYSVYIYRELIVGFRNGFIIPDGYWTPDSLAQKFATDTKNSSFKLYDLLLTVNQNFQESKLERYFSEAYNQGVRVYIIPVTKVNFKYPNETDFLTQFIEKLKNDYYFDVNKIVFGLYIVWDEKFTIKIGSEIGGDLNENEMREFQASAVYWYNLETAYLRFMQNTRFYVVGERMGWTGEILAKYLSEITDYEHPDFYFHNYDLGGSLTDDYYVEGIMKGLYSEIGLHSLGFYLKKLHKSESYSSFASGFFKYYQFATEKYKLSNTEFIFVIADKKEDEIIIGDEFKDKMPISKIEEIKNKAKPLLSSGKYLDTFKEIMKWLRYEMIIKGNEFTPSIFAAYFNDFYGKNYYYFYQQNEVITQEEITSTLKEYFEKLKNNNFFTFIFSFNKLYPYFEENLDKFAYDLVSKFSEKYNIVSPDHSRFVIIVYHQTVKKFAIDKANGLTTYLFPENIKHILQTTNPDGKIDSFKNIMKYIRYYLILSPNDWTVTNILDYIKDFMGQANPNILFDPSKILKSSQYDKIVGYLNDLSQKSIPVYYFNIKNTRTQDEQIIDDLINAFTYPDNINKNNSIFIFYYFNKDVFHFRIGKDLTDKISQSDLNQFTKESVIKYKHSYDITRYILMSMRKIVYKDDKWTGIKLANHYNKNYPITQLNYDLVDYYLQLVEDNENFLIDKIKNITETHSINLFTFIIDDMDPSTNITQFSNDLFDNIDNEHIKDKDLTLIVAYIINEKKINIKSGNKIKHIIPKTNGEQIVENSLSKFENCNDILNEIYQQINISLNIKNNYTPKDLKDIVDKDYKNQNYLIFDPHFNLNNNQFINLNTELLQITKKNVYMFNFIMAKLGNVNEDINSYLNELTNNFPVSSVIKNDPLIFSIYITSTNQFAIKLVNGKRLGDKFSKKLKSIKDSASKHFNEGVFDGYNYAIIQINDNLPNNGKSSSKITWKVLSFSLVGVVILCIAIIILMRIFKKNANASNYINENDPNKYTNMNMSDTAIIN